MRAAFLIVLLLAPFASAAEPPVVKLDGHLEWRLGDVLVVDGQRVRPATEAKWQGRGEAKGPGSIPIGYEVEAKGVRLSDGTVLARELEARPNDDDALFEQELVKGFDEIEKEYRREGTLYEEDEESGEREEYGELIEDGPGAARVRAMVDRLVPSYRRREDFRVYVVKNEEWNAMAAPNGAIFVFSGLLESLDDGGYDVTRGPASGSASRRNTATATKW